MSGNRVPPPEEFRWKKKQSGNPRGRPVKNRLKALINQIDPASGMVLSHRAKTLSRRNAKGKIEEVPRDEAALDKLYQMGMSGDRRALIHYLAISGEAQDKEAKIKNDILAEAIRYMDLHMPKFVEAEKNGDPFPEIFPDPRDITINADGTVTVDGPMSKAQSMGFDLIKRQRDAAILLLDGLSEAAHLSARKRNEMRKDMTEKRDYYDSLLPARMRLQNEEYLEN